MLFRSLLSETVQVRIEGDSASERLTIHVENSNLEEVLAQLALKFGFEFNAPNAKKKNSEPQWTATLAAGNLESLLQRLLRNHNHSIIRSDGAGGPIRKVLLLETRSGSKLMPAPNLHRDSRIKRRAAKRNKKPSTNLIKPETGKTPLALAHALAGRLAAIMQWRKLTKKRFPHTSRKTRRRLLL